MSTTAFNNDSADSCPTRFATGIAGLDVILKGGLVSGGIYIIQGAPGSGKTILGNQLCFTVARQGGRALYVTLLAETHARMMTNMRQMSFFDQRAVPDRVSYLGAFRALEDHGLRGLLDMIRQEVRATGAQLIVLDGMATAGEKASDLELKKFVHELQTQASFTDCTMVLLTSGARHPLPLSPEYTMVDGLIEFRTRIEKRRAFRILQVQKMRGTDFLEGEHAVRIDANGIQVFPRLEAWRARPSREDQADGGKVTVGVEGLDRLLDGGVERCSTTVVLGPAGSGKTTIGLQFLSACHEQERGLLFGFYENAPALRQKGKSLGLPFDSRVEEGHVEIIWQPFSEALVDEVCQRILSRVKEGHVRRVFLDGMEGFQALCPDPDRLPNLIAVLCNELRALGVTTLITGETELAGLSPGAPLAGLGLRGLSPVAENIIVLRLAALRAEIHRLLAVLKARHNRNDPRMRLFDIEKGGIVIEPDFGKAGQVLRELAQQGALLPPTGGPIGGA